MHRRYVGLGFVMVSAFLYTSRYFLAILGGANPGFKEQFEKMYEGVGAGLTGWAVVSLLAGVVYIVWGEVQEWLQRVSGNTVASNSR